MFHFFALGAAYIINLAHLSEGPSFRRKRGKGGVKMSANWAFELVSGEVPSMISLMKYRGDANDLFDLLALEQHLKRFAVSEKRDALLKELAEEIKPYSNSSCLLEAANVLTVEGWLEDSKMLMRAISKGKQGEWSRELGTILLGQLDDGLLGLMNIRRRLGCKLNVNMDECVEFVTISPETFLQTVDWVEQMVKGYDFLPDLQRRDRELADSLDSMYMIIEEAEYRGLSDSEREER
jgi:hypothetical protein